MSKNQKATIWQFVILILSFVVLGSLFAEAVFNLSADTKQILQDFDTVVCVIFLIDFFWNLFTAKNKLKYLRWGWIDFVSSIPTLDYFRVGRLARIIRIFKILRGVRSVKVISSYVFEHRAQGTFTAAILISVLLMFFSAIAILQVETVPESNIKTAEDALWWSFSTITTVGNSDKSPVTTEGKIFAAILAVFGVGLFGVFTGFIASWFVEGAEDSDIKKLEREVKELKDLIKNDDLNRRN